MLRFFFLRIHIKQFGEWHFRKSPQMMSKSMFSFPQTHSAPHFSSQPLPHHVRFRSREHTSGDLLTHGDAMSALFRSSTRSAWMYNIQLELSKFPKFPMNTCWIIPDMLYPSLLLLHVDSHSLLRSTPCSSDCLVSIYRLVLTAARWPIVQSHCSPT